MPEESKKFFQAIKDGDLVCITGMLMENSDLLHKPYQVGITGKTYYPLAYAYEQEQLDICHYLLDAGADVNIAIFEDTSLVGEMISMGLTEPEDKRSIALDALKNDRMEYARLFAAQETFSFDLDDKLAGRYDVFAHAVEYHKDDIYQDIFAKQMTVFYESRVDGAKSRIKQAEKYKENLERRLHHFQDCAKKEEKHTDIENAVPLPAKKFKK